MIFTEMQARKKQLDAPGTLHKQLYFPYRSASAHLIEGGGGIENITPQLECRIRTRSIKGGLGSVLLPLTECLWSCSAN